MNTISMRFVSKVWVNEIRTERPVWTPFLFNMTMRSAKPLRPPVGNT